MKALRTNFVWKIISVYLVIYLVFPQAFMPNAFALTGGPSQPEFQAFTPIETSDMVSLSTGDFNYNIPIMDVGGYPINLAYNSGVTMDQEASWVGLGWNLNVGQISRNVRGIPDDFDGSQADADLMTYENNFRDNITIGSSFSIGPSLFGWGESDVSLGNDISLNVGIGVQYNNYTGISVNPSFGPSFSIDGLGTVGFDVTGSASDGPSVRPYISANKRFVKKKLTDVNGGLGVTINSRKALDVWNLSASAKVHELKYFVLQPIRGELEKSGSAGGSMSFNDLVLFTPTKRVGTTNTNLTFNASVGLSFWGISGQAKISGFRGVQSIKESERNKQVKAFGYDNTEKNEALNDGILDFNREKDRSFSRNTTLLPVVNYTYDMYSIQGQGVGGSFRPYRSQIGYVNDLYVTDNGTGESLGAEVAGGNIFSGGFDIKITDTKSSTGLWTKQHNNFALDNFTNKDPNNLSYEKVYYRTMGELNVDNENQVTGGGIYQDKLKGRSPLNLNVGGSRYSRNLQNDYRAISSTVDPLANSESIELGSGKLQRSNRLLRNQSIQKVTVAEVKNTNGRNPYFEINEEAKDHHTAGYNILKPDGSNYIFGKAAYNYTKKEATFNVDDYPFDDATGLIQYTAGSDNSSGNRNGKDHYFNRITTPAYAHSYLLTSILSADYEDLTGNGPSDDDLGAYTKFNYDNSYDYNWRVPFEANKASGNRGLYSLDDDQKGNYLYGTREQVYIKTIETKTHIATFHLTPRNDGWGVQDEDGGRHNSTRSQKLDSIRLYSKKEFQAYGSEATPIKTAHFEYNYDLCQNIPNYHDPVNPSVKQGKLTLEKVYFTYENSKMGAYMPYLFSYGEVDSNGDGIINDFDTPSNPPYDMKGYDIWGNYKENTGNSDVTSPLGPTNSEFPYTEQNKNVADINTAAWTLTSVQLPSGGDLQVEYESDDYQFVQDKNVMQLYEVYGVGSDVNSPTNNEYLYDYSSATDPDYLYVKIPANQSSFTAEDFVNGLSEEPIFFRFLVQMNKNSNTNYEYVSGYLNIDTSKEIKKNGNYLSIPVELLTLDGKGSKKYSPIAKAGWFFGRQNLKQLLYVGENYDDDVNAVTVIKALVGSMQSITDMFKGPNKVLRDKGAARKFKPNKSWIRLVNPTKHKFGGGSRVKRLQMGDNWDVMTNNTDDTLYSNFYGQTYSYEDENGGSSGVATFEPNASKENPFVLPFYNKESTKKDKILAPMESNYVEKPIGESFFPAPMITYGKVTVANLEKQDINAHATGKVVSEFYTSKDFPTIVDYTPLDENSMKYDKPSGLGQLININVKTHAVASQGFSIELNDMNGKQKAQWVYAENGESHLSGVEYHYYIDDNGLLKNDLPVIDKDGSITEQLIGVNYDVINDFRESNSETKTYGVNVNFGGFLVAIFPFLWGVPIPSYAQHENLLQTATTTKVVQRHGILKETVAHDLGSKVSTENLAWDANTGEILVTKTINGFDDAYYSLNYPAYWMYDGMASATINLGLEGVIEEDPSTNEFKLLDNSGGVVDPADYLIPGDELFTYYPELSPDAGKFYEKLWVISTDNNRIILMDRYGVILNDCSDDPDVNSLKFKVMRSGHRNLQSGSMANITTEIDPITPNINGTLPSFTGVTSSNAGTFKIINAGAIEYTDFWKPQKENGMPYFAIPSAIYNDGLPTADENGLISDLNEDQFLTHIDRFNINPYVYNMKGEWRARRSWAYLTGRQHTSGTPDLRNDGHFTSYTPFYKYNGSEWEINQDAVIENTGSGDDIRWTFASQVTQYSAYGTELENKDALNRYSSAQYGHKYTLPVAVASNSEYREMGYEGFEDHGVLFPVVANSNQHFTFGKEGLNLGESEVVENIAHTGRKSIKVTPGGIATLTRSFSDYVPAPIDDCAGGTIGGSICSDLRPPQQVVISSTQSAPYATAFGYGNNPDILSVSVTLENFVDGNEFCDIAPDDQNQRFTWQPDPVTCPGNNATVTRIYRVDVTTTSGVQTCNNVTVVFSLEENN